MPRKEVITSLTPMLTVDDGRAAIEFYKHAFDAKESGRVEDSGKLIIAEVEFFGVKFYVSDESEENGNISPRKAGGTTIRLELIVEDPDAIVERAASYGAKVIFPVTDHDYGYRQGRIEDPFGHQWVIGRPL